MNSASVLQAREIQRKGERQEQGQVVDGIFMDLLLESCASTLKGMLIPSQVPTQKKVTRLVVGVTQLHEPPSFTWPLYGSNFTVSVVATASPLPGEAKEEREGGKPPAKQMAGCVCVGVMSNKGSSQNYQL